MSPSTTSANGPSESVRFVPLSYDNTDSHPSALRLVLTLFPEWEHADGKIEFVRFTDGITNTLLKIVIRRPGATDEQVDGEAVLLRAYGSGTDVLIDRERECASHSILTQYHLAPALLARFENGLLYRFIRGRVCTSKDLTREEIWRGVARRLGEWHGILPLQSAPPSHPNGDLANGYAGQYQSEGSNGHSTKSNGVRSIISGKPEPNIWTVMQKWLHALPAKTEAQRKRNTILQQELERSVSEFGNSPGPGIDGLVFAHCDLLSGNVIRHPKEDGVVAADGVEVISFIDYEYATPSPAAFDIANFFAEWGGFECDYTVLPTVSQRRGFLEEYVRSYNTHNADKNHCSADAKQLLQQVNDFRGLPGFYWGIWALIQATISQIDFDYAAYAEKRLGEYWAWREELDGTREKDRKEKPLRERRWAQEA